MDNLWNLVDIKSENECWNFIGKTISKKGYAFIRRNNKMIRAHRYAYFLKHPLTVSNVNELKLHVLHKCDNRRCCNPNHLFLGTNDDNVADKMEKERQARGESHGMAILTETQVHEIREKWKNKLKTQQELATEYGLKNRKTISAICCRRRWKYLL